MHFIKMLGQVPALDAWRHVPNSIRRYGSQCLLNQFAYGLVARRLRNNAMTRENAAGVSVYHEHRQVPGVQQDGICRLSAYSVQCQQLVAKDMQGGRGGAITGKHPAQRACVACIKILNESLKTARFLPKESGSANKLLQLS